LFGGASSAFDMLLNFFLKFKQTYSKEDNMFFMGIFALSIGKHEGNHAKLLHEFIKDTKRPKF